MPSADKILKKGKVVNIDLSAELNGFWADNGGSFVSGEDIHGHGKLVNTSKEILKKAISNIKGGVKISEIGKLIETEAKKAGYTVIKTSPGMAWAADCTKNRTRLLTIATSIIPIVSKRIRW